MANLPRDPARPAPDRIGRAPVNKAPAPGFLVPIDLLPPPKSNNIAYKVRRPSTAESFIPIVGPAWEGIADYQEGNYAGAAFNGAMAVADALPISPAAKLLTVMFKLSRRYGKGLASADAMRKRFKAMGLTSPGREVHHTLALNGANRSAKGDVRNHAAFLKVMPREQHRRLTGSWQVKLPDGTSQRLPRYNQAQRLWYGTTDGQKAFPTAVGAKAVDSWQNFTRPDDPTPSRQR